MLSIEINEIQTMIVFKANPHHEVSHAEFRPIRKQLKYEKIEKDNVGVIAILVEIIK